MVRKQNLLLIGGFGFIGSNLLDRFLASGKYNVIVFEFTNMAPKRSSHLDDAKIYYGDFNNSKDLESVFSENQIDIVMHLISTTVPATSNANIVYDIQSNVVDSVLLLEMMLQYKITKIVYLSSGGTIYGVPTTFPIKEEAETNPICSYGITKLAIEKYIHLFHHLYGIEYLILRPSNPYGPFHTSTKQGLINVMLRKILAKEPITIWGDGSVVRDYIYIEDMAEITYQIIENISWNQIVNVGYGHGYSIRELLEIMEKSFSGVRVEYQPARGFDIKKLVLDTTRMNSLCNVKQIEIEKGILKTYMWLTGSNSQ